MVKLSNNRITDHGWTHCLIDAIGHLLHVFGWHIGRFPIIFIIGSLTISLTLTTGLYFVTIHNDLIFGYTPDDAPAHQENAVYREYFDIKKGPFGMAIFIEAKDGGSLLRDEYFEAVYNFSNFVKEFTISTDEVENYTYSMSCEPRCNMNVPIELYKKGIEHQRLRISSGQPPSTDFLLTYPIAHYLNARVDMGNNFHNVTVNESMVNVTGTSMMSSSVIDIVFMADEGNSSMQTALKQWELELFDYSIKMIDPYIRVFIFGNHIANEEGMRAGMGIIPYFVGGWALMLVFVMVVVILSAMYYNRMDWTKIVVVFTAWITPILAVGATFGLMSYLGQPLNALMGVIPLLVVAIGVDDAFLMLHSWQRHSQQQDIADHSIADKTALVFYEIVPSVAITSITNSLAFAVGVFTPMPDIRRFCMVTSIAMAMDFIFELTLFGPVLSWSGSVESSAIDPKWPNLDRSLRRFLDSYSRFLTKWQARILMVLAIATCWIVGVFGISQMKADFQPQKSFSSDSPLLHATYISTVVIHDEHHMNLFFVNKPPNLANKTEYQRFEAMINQLETMPNCLGEENTFLWLRHYIPWSLMADDGFNWLDGDDNESELSYDDVPFFMETSMSQPFRTAVKYQHFEHENRVEVTAFYFAIFYANMTDFMDRVELGRQTREILLEYPEFNATFYEYESSLYDLSMAVKHVMLRAVIVTMACMAVVCLLFIPNLCCVLVATFAIGSICVGTLGILGLWGIDIDPMTMVNMIMSVGFNVDYTAHIVYHYHSNGATASSDSGRLLASLHSVAVPMIEAGLSTVVCVGLLGFNSVYMFTVFFKTILLVVCIGLIHGLFIVPTVLAWLPDCMTGAYKIKQREEDYPLKIVENNHL